MERKNQQLDSDRHQARNQVWAAKAGPEQDAQLGASSTSKNQVYAQVKVTNLPEIDDKQLQSTLVEAGHPVVFASVK